jgi:hypothetical protein
MRDVSAEQGHRLVRAGATTGLPRAVVLLSANDLRTSRLRGDCSLSGSVASGEADEHLEKAFPDMESAEVVRRVEKR